MHLKLFDVIFKIVFLLILFLGLILRFYFYFANRDLGADEAHLALNFIHLGYKGLLQPLENFQSAPIFFLWSVETITRFFGFSELSLRFIPFVFSVLSFPLFYFFVRDLTKNRIIAVVSFLLFALNYSIIYFSTELKPYTIDVSSFIIIGFLIFSNSAAVSKRRVLLLAICGSLFLLFSISSVIILFCTSLILLKIWHQKQKEVTKEESRSYFENLLYLFILWGLVFITNFFIFIYKHPYAEGMKNIWNWAFCPSNIFSKEFVSFVDARIEDTIFSNLLLFNKDHYFSYFLLFLTVVSIIHLIVHKKYTVILFSLFLILLHIVLSMLHMYPFYQRFILYLLPSFIILFSYGFVVVLEFITKKTHWIITCGLLLFFVFHTNIISAKKYASVSKEHEIQPVLNYIDKRYPNSTVLIATPYTLYAYYYETGRVKNRNFKAIDWYLKPEEFKYHKAVINLTHNYLLLYSIGDDFDGFGETLKDLKMKGQIINKFDYSIFQISEIEPQTLKNHFKLIQHYDYEYFSDIQPSNQGSKSFIPLWNNIPISVQVNLAKGKYQFSLIAKGDPVKGIYPHLNIDINNKKIAEVDLTNELETHIVHFEIITDSNQTISIAMNNDEINGEEDRNAFIGDIFIFKDTVMANLND